MAGNLSNYLENKLLNHCLGNAAFVMPATVYAGLFTVTPTDTGGGTEVNAAGYIRVPTSWGLAVSGASSNSADIRFPSSGVTSADWGTVVALGLFDASSAGNLLWYGPLSANVPISLGDDFIIAVNGLTLTLD